jgi:hypothetical protein
MGVTTVGARLSFDRAKAAIQDAGFGLNRAVLSQSYLRSEVVLSTSQTRYRFPILVNDNFGIGGGLTTTSTTQLLQLQDAFYISHIGLYFAKPTSSTDSTFQLCTYPNAIIFSTANTASSLYQFYNGYMTLTVNNRVVLPNLDGYRFYDVPQTQDGSAAAVIDQQKGSDSALYPIEPGIVLVGSKQNVLEFILPASLTAVETNSRAVVIMYGHLAQNVTPVN